jgi:hypothetical protein
MEQQEFDACHGDQLGYNSRNNRKHYIGDLMHIDECILMLA